MRTLYTVQHCQSEHHVNGMVGGITDWPLTPLGLRQAHQLGRRLAEELAGAPLALYSSDLRRARQTAEVLSEYLGAGIIYRPMLREIDLGRATGHSLKWLEVNRAEHPPGAPRLGYRALPDAESEEELYLRAGIVAKEIEELKTPNAVVVGHGGSLRMLAAYFLQIPLPVLEHLAFHGSAGGVSVMERRPDGLRVLRRWNDPSYIEGA